MVVSTKPAFLLHSKNDNFFLFSIGSCSLWGRKMQRTTDLLSVPDFKPVPGVPEKCQDAPVSGNIYSMISFYNRARKFPDFDRF